MTDLILYTTEDGRSRIKLRAKDQAVWLTQLDSAATVKESSTAQFSTRRVANCLAAIGEATAEKFPVVGERGESGS